MGKVNYIYYERLLIMAVGLNTNLNTYGYNQNYMGNNLGTAGLTNSTQNNTSFSNPLFQQTTNNYEEDMMMPAELKLSSINPQSVTTPATNASNPVTGQVETQNAQAQNITEKNATSPAQTPFTAAPDASAQLAENSGVNNSSVETPEELNNYLLARDKNIATTENGNIYRKTDKNKGTFTLLGFLAPLAGKVVQLFKGGKFKDLFKFKQLAIACPVVALAGYGIGTLVDGYINSQRAKAADATVMYKNPYEQQPFSIKA